MRRRNPRGGVAPGPATANAHGPAAIVRAVRGTASAAALCLGLIAAGATPATSQNPPPRSPEPPGEALAAHAPDDDGSFGHLAGRLQQGLDSARTAMGARGVSAAVILPDDRVWVGTSGEARGGVPVTPETLFEIGSVTKTFTAALLVELDRDGIVSLHDTVGRWVPDVPDGRGVTLEMLLRHTSGIADVMAHPELIPTLIRDPARRWSSRELLDFVGPRDFAPGESWKYSNTGYHLAGMAAEAATGRTVGALLRQRFFEPVGLPRTFYAATEAVVRPRAHAFLDVNEDGEPDDLTALIPATSFHTAAGPAGAVMSTAEDLARWIRALHTGEVLDSVGYAALTELVDRPDGRRYGLGTLVDDLAGHTAYGHEGNSTGFSTAAWHLPDAGVTVAVLANIHAVKVRPVTRALLSALGLGRPEPAPGAAPPPGRPSPIAHR